MNLVFGFTAGVVSILSPCVLPLIPVVLAGAVFQHRFGPLALMGGLVLSFTATGFLFAVFGIGLGLERETVRIAAAVVMVLAGILIFFANLQQRLLRLTEPVFEGLKTFIGRFNARGLGGQAALGALLGIVWSPCAGPTLGAAIGLAMQKDSLLNASTVMLAFAIGAVTPLLLITYGSGYAIGRRQRLAVVARFAKPVLGLFLLLVGASIISGTDKVAEVYLTKAMPVWLVDITTRF